MPLSVLNFGDMVIHWVLQKRPNIFHEKNNQQATELGIETSKQVFQEEKYSNTQENSYQNEDKEFTGGGNWLTNNIQKGQKYLI